MSREQWGHGYWNGVKDALNGKIKTSIQDYARWLVCNMCISNSHKTYDKLLFPVQEFLWYCDFCGLSVEYARKIYDYIMIKEPFGCYVSGQKSNSWVNDYFVLPYDTEENWQKRADQIAAAW